MPAGRGRTPRWRATPRSQHSGSPACRIRSLLAVIRTLWYYVVLLATTIVHAIGAVVAGLFRVRHRRGGGYGWGGAGGAGDILRAAGAPGLAGGLGHLPRDPP